MTANQRLHQLSQSAEALRALEDEVRHRRALLDSQVLLAIGEGINPTQISRATQLSRETVYKAVRRREERERAAGRA